MCCLLLIVYLWSWAILLGVKTLQGLVWCVHIMVFLLLHTNKIHNDQFVSAQDTIYCSLVNRHHHCKVLSL